MIPLALILAGVVLAFAATINDLQHTNMTLGPAAVVGRLEGTQLGPFTMVTTVAQTFDTVLVDSYGRAQWELHFTKSDGTTLTRTVDARHNGTASADATTATCSIEGGGISSELTSLDVDLSGAGAAQLMRLRCTMTYGAGTWKVTTWRLPMKPPQYA